MRLFNYGYLWLHVMFSLHFPFSLQNLLWHHQHAGLWEKTKQNRCFSILYQKCLKKSVQHRTSETVFLNLKTNGAPKMLESIFSSTKKQLMLITCICPFPHDQFSFTVQKDFKAKKGIKMNYSGKCGYWIIRLQTETCVHEEFHLYYLVRRFKERKCFQSPYHLINSLRTTQCQDLGLRLRLAQENQTQFRIRKLCLA